MRYYARLKATTVSSYNCFRYCRHFHILKKLGACLGRVFSAIWGEWVNGLCHCDQSPLGTQLGVETQPLRASFGPKIDSPDAMANIKSVRLFSQ